MVVTPFDVLEERMLIWSFADSNATTYLLDLVGAVTGMIVVMPFDVLSGRSISSSLPEIVPLLTC